MTETKIFKLLWLWVKKNFSKFHIIWKGHYMFCWHENSRIFKFRVDEDKLEVWNDSDYYIEVMENALTHYVLVDERYDYFTAGLKEHFTIRWETKKEQGS